MARTTPTVFITGGAGFLGINLIRTLLKQGCRIISYDIAPFDYPEAKEITAITGDIRHQTALAKAMTGSTLVVHCAAALPLYTPETIMTTDVDGTKNVLATAHKLGIKRVVHISSTAVYGIPDHHPLLETDRLDGVGPYGKAKIAAEALCLTYRKKGLIVPIIRPKSFVGPERLGVFALFYDWAKDGKGFPLIGNGKNRYQLLDVADLCEAIWLCLVLPKSKVNDTFNIGAKDYQTMGEDYQAVLDTAGFGKKVRPTPAGPTIAFLRLLEMFKISPLYKWVYETASKDSFVSIAKAEQKLGWHPRYSNQQALVRNYKWYIKHMDHFTHQTGITHRAPWKQGILRLFKVFF